jgi:hypothetical protein
VQSIPGDRRFIVLYNEPALILQVNFGAREQITMAARKSQANPLQPRYRDARAGWRAAASFNHYAIRLLTTRRPSFWRSNFGFMNEISKCCGGVTGNRRLTARAA